MECVTTTDTLYRAHVAQTTQDEAAEKQALAVIFFSRDEDRALKEVDLMDALTRKLAQPSSQVPNTIVRTH